MQTLNSFCFDVSPRASTRGFGITERFVVASDDNNNTVVHSLECPGCQRNPGLPCPDHHVVLETGLTWGAVYHPTGHLMLTISRESPAGKVGLWDLDLGAHIRDFTGHQDSVCTVAFMNESAFASASADGVILLWNSAAEGPTAVLRGHDDAVNELLMLDNVHLASGCHRNTVRIWDTITSTCVRVLQSSSPELDHRIMCVLSLGPSRPDGKPGYLRAGSMGVVQIWDWDAGELVAHLPDADSRVTGQLCDDLDGNLITYGVPGIIHTWTQDGVRIGASHAAHDAPVRMVMQLDRRFAVTVGSKDGVVKLWDWGTAGGEKRWLFDLFSGVWLITNVSVAFGKLAIASREKDRKASHVRVWDLEDIRKLAISHAQ
ncbi:hypothetical protein RB595_003123 [Gaeumannomyces hyphopodioides]